MDGSGAPGGKPWPSGDPLATRRSWPRDVWKKLWTAGASSSQRTADPMPLLPGVDLPVPGVAGAADRQKKTGRVKHWGPADSGQRTQNKNEITKTRKHVFQK